MNIEVQYLQPFTRIIALKQNHKQNITFENTGQDPACGLHTPSTKKSMHLKLSVFDPPLNLKTEYCAMAAAEWLDGRYLAGNTNQHVLQ